MKSREKYARSYPMVTDSMNILIRDSKGTKCNSRGQLGKNLIAGPPARVTDGTAEYPATETSSKGKQLKKGRAGLGSAAQRP